MLWNVFFLTQNKQKMRLSTSLFLQFSQNRSWIKDGEV